MNTLHIERTTSDNKDFRWLVAQLDQYLAGINGDKNDFFAAHNKVDLINHVVVAYLNHVPVGCGAIKMYNSETMEVKRMYVPANYRGQGIATVVLLELEKWSAELGYPRCILETAKSMVDAVALYKKNNYRITPNYGQYAHVESSVCFEKAL